MEGGTKLHRTLEAAFCPSVCPGTGGSPAGGSKQRLFPRAADFWSDLRTEGWTTLCRRRMAECAAALNSLRLSGCCPMKLFRPACLQRILLFSKESIFQGGFLPVLWNEGWIKSFLPFEPKSLVFFFHVQQRSTAIRAVGETFLSSF